MTDRPQSTLLPVALVLVAMASVQTGAAVAKHLFPLVGSTGAASLRLLYASAILCAVLRPWKLRNEGRARYSILVYGIPLGAMNSLFSPSLLPFALPVAVLLSALPYSLEMVALGRMPTKTFGTPMSLEPAVGALSGMLILSERDVPHLSDPPL